MILSFFGIYMISDNLKEIFVQLIGEKMHFLILYIEKNFLYVRELT